jgi:hypothetical protein
VEAVRRGNLSFGKPGLDLTFDGCLRGVVCLASPTKLRHGRPHARLLYWLQSYAEATPGVEAATNATVRLDLESEPQPDAILCVEPSLGGRTAISLDDCVEGPPELVAEVSAGTLRRDLGLKLDLVFPGLWLDPAALFRNDLRRLREVVLAGTSTPEHAAFVARLRGRRG